MKTLTFLFSLLCLTLSGGSSFSAAVSAIVITNQPLSQTILHDGTVTLTVGAASASPLSYQWTLNGTNLSGATNSSLTISNAQPADQGTYVLQVSNVAGNTNSSPATLTILTNVVPPFIMHQPTNQTVPQGGTATFTVVASGTLPLSYQWYFSKQSIPGATDSSFTINQVQPSNAGPYYVVVSNAWGTGTSAVAILTVSTSCPSIMAPGLLPGFEVTGLPPSNDNPSTNVSTCFPFCFCGAYYTNVWVNNDGNITLDRPFGTRHRLGFEPPSFEPAIPLRYLGRVIFAPFWADIDTTAQSGSGSVKWGCGCVNVNGTNRQAFGVTWRDVGYFPDIGERSDKTNSFQMLIIERSDLGFGSFDLQYRYATIQWDTASSCSGTKGLCIRLPTGDAKGFPARVGFASGTNCWFEFPESGECNQALLDSGTNALAHSSSGLGANGVYTWRFIKCTNAVGF